HASSRSVLPCLLTPPPTPNIHTLSLHDALPISFSSRPPITNWPSCPVAPVTMIIRISLASPIGWTLPPSSKYARYASANFLKVQDRKSTRLNSSHQIISYAVFCLKKKNQSV